MINPIQTTNKKNQGSLVLNLLDTGPVVLEKMKMWKVYDNDYGQRTKAHLSMWFYDFYIYHHMIYMYITNYTQIQEYTSMSKSVKATAKLDLVNES